MLTQINETDFMDFFESLTWVEIARTGSYEHMLALYITRKKNSFRKINIISSKFIKKNRQTIVVYKYET